MSGYKKIKLKNGKTIDEHRLIWIKEYGEIPKGYVIHHIDGDKTNNNLSNLECISLSEHSRRHRIGNGLSQETKEKISKKRTDYFEKLYSTIPNGYWVCIDCHQLLPLDRFYKISRNFKGHSYRCKECRKKKRNKK